MLNVIIADENTFIVKICPMSGADPIGFPVCLDNRIGPGVTMQGMVFY